MYKVNNVRVVSDGTIFSFHAPKTGSHFAFSIRFVAHKDEHGRIQKGVRIEKINDSRNQFPEGAQLKGATGEPFRPGDIYTLPKAHNSCSLTDVDGTNYELFSVQLVDQGEDTDIMSKRAGGVLYFHSTAAIPTELGGEGILRDDPTHDLE